MIWVMTSMEENLCHMCGFLVHCQTHAEPQHIDDGWYIQPLVPSESVKQHVAALFATTFGVVHRVPILHREPTFEHSFQKGLQAAQKCEPTGWNQSQWTERNTEKPTYPEIGITNAEEKHKKEQCRKTTVWFGCKQCGMFQNWIQAARYVSESKPHNIACYRIRSKLYDLFQN